jgi:hypothetical protein
MSISSNTDGRVANSTRDANKRTVLAFYEAGLDEKDFEAAATLSASATCSTIR